ncbi:SSU ribosomal protein S16p [hydrothermal vent metagenome]|uniref:SSU ribosomal protein S16p n=1 Tax=hydrothermal vent metagenome TaxID=652676 RepID=A0A1W1BIZ0_9ZZZZ
MVKIRLARGGAKKKPFYSITVTDSRKPRDSGYIEKIGYFNPVARGQEVRLNIEEDRLEHWKSQGAQLSDRVKQLVKEFKNPEIFAKKKALIAKKAQEAKAKKEAEEKARILAEEKAAKEEEKAAADAEKEAEKVEETKEEVIEETKEENNEEA